MQKQTNFARPIFLLLLVLTVVVIATVLKLASSVVLPVTIAILISLVFEPIIVTINKKFHIPWVLGIVVVLSIVLVSIYILGTLVINSLRTIFDSYLKYEERFMFIYKNIATLFSLPFNEDNSLFDNLWGQLGVRQAVQTATLSLSTNIIGLLKNLLLIFLFCIFFLLDLRYLRQKLEYAFDDSHKGRVTLIITDIIQQVTRYISVKFYISLLTGILVYLGALIVKLDFPIVWAFLAFILNFIPNFGSIISCILTSVFALVQFWPKPGPVVFVVIVMVGVNFILGNFIEPRIQGRNLGLSPFIIIVSLSFWGWLWGFAGLVLGVPMMVILKIICDNFSILQPLSTIMGTYTSHDKTEKTVVEEQGNLHTDTQSKNK